MDVNTRTGALIIIERSTRLGELYEQENAVRVDAIVSSALLRQIFYTGSPLHDGAVVIRDGRVAAARVHIALSDNYHLRRDFGLRHRAAVGASEMGDAIAVVVSEERGTISIAVDGVLHVLGNADSLRTHLHRLLGIVEEMIVDQFSDGSRGFSAKAKSQSQMSRSRKLNTLFPL